MLPAKWRNIISSRDVGHYVVTDDVLMIDYVPRDSQVLFVMHSIENKTSESLNAFKTSREKCVDSENSHDLIGEINVKSATQTCWLLEAEQSRRFSRSDCSMLRCMLGKRCSRLF